jgi:precorrin-4 methylase
MSHLKRQLILILVLALFIPGAALAAQGNFFLVSVGCGDADNITLKAMKTIKKSEVIFCSDQMKKQWPDLFEGKTCLALPPVSIHKYFRAVQTGFAQGKPSKKEKPAAVAKALDAFVQTVTRAIGSGKNVSLLENGDPCIYGPYIWTTRVFKEMNPKVIPGVSCFNAANAALGKGVTFGRAAHSAILTNAADLRPGYTGKDTLERLAATRSSLVFFTMFTEFEKLVNKLGSLYPENTPVAIVAKAGYEADERIIQGTLANIISRVKAAGPIPFEHLVYLGDFMEE